MLPQAPTLKRLDYHAALYERVSLNVLEYQHPLIQGFGRFRIRQPQKVIDVGKEGRVGAFLHLKGSHLTLSYRTRRIGTLTPGNSLTQIEVRLASLFTHSHGDIK